MFCCLSCCTVDESDMNKSELDEDSVLKKWNDRVLLITVLVLALGVATIGCFFIVKLLPSPDPFFSEAILSRCKWFDSLNPSTEHPTVHEVKTFLTIYAISLFGLLWVSYRIIPVFLLTLFASLLPILLFNCIPQGRIIMVKWFIPRYNLWLKQKKESNELDKRQFKQFGLDKLQQESV